MKLLGKLIRWTLMLAVVLVVAALIVPNFVDWNQYRGQIAEAARDALGRDVSIDGDLSFSVLPAPHLNVNDLRIANLAGASTVDFLKLETLEINVALLPLLRGEVRVEQMVLVRPVFELEQLADGRSSWDFDLASEEEADVPSDSPVNLQLQSLLVEDGDVTYRAPGQDAPLTVSGMDVELSADSLEGPFRAEGQVNLNTIPMAFDVLVGNMANRSRTRLDVNLDIADGAAELVFDGRIEGLDDVPTIIGNLSGEGESLRRLMNSLPEAENSARSLSIPFSFRGSVNGTADAISLQEMALSLGSTQGEGAVNLTLGDVLAAKLLLVVKNLEVEKLLSELALDADTPAEDSPFSLPDGVTANMDLTVEAASWQGGVIRQGRVAAKLEGGILTLAGLRGELPGGSVVSATGKLRAKEGKPDFSGQVKLNATNLRALLGWFDVPLDSIRNGRLNTAEATAQIVASDSLVQLLNVTGTVDNMKITGGVAYALRDRLSFSADLALDALDADAYLVAREEEAGSLQDVLKPLADFDANLRLRVGRLVYGGASYGGVHVQVGLLAGVLELQDVHVDSLAGSRLALTGKITDLGKTPNADITGTLRADDLTGLLKLADQQALSPQRLGRLDTRFTAAGTLKKMQVGAKGNLGGTALDVSGTVTDVEAAEQGFTLRATVTNKSLAALLAQVDFTQFQPKARDDAPVSVGATLSGKLTDMTFNISVDAAGTLLTLNGKAKGAAPNTRYDLTVAGKSDDYVRSLRAAGIDVDPAKIARRAMNMTADVVYSGSKSSISNMDVTIGEASLQGNLTYTVSDNGKGALTGTLKAGDLVLEHFLPPADTGAKQARQELDMRWSEDPFDLSAMQDTDADIGFTASKLAGRGYIFEKAKGTIVVRDGVLRIDGLKGVIFGGPMEANVKLNSYGLPRLEADLKVTGAAVGQALLAAADLTVMTGTFDLSGKWTAQGRSQAEMIKNLNGDTAFEARDGVINGINLNEFSNQLSQANWGGNILGKMAALGRLTMSSRGSSSYEKISGKLPIQQGVITFTDVVALFDQARGTTTGTLDLNRWYIDSRTEFKLLAEVHSNRPPFKLALKGPLFSPESDLQTQAIMNSLMNLPGFLRQAPPPSQAPQTDGSGSGPVPSTGSGGPAPSTGDGSVAPDPSSGPSPSPSPLPSSGDGDAPAPSQQQGQPQDDRQGTGGRLLRNFLRVITPPAEQDAD